MFDSCHLSPHKQNIYYYFLFLKITTVLVGLLFIKLISNLSLYSKCTVSQYISNMILLVYKSDEKGKILTENLLWKALAGTEFWTCYLQRFAAIPSLHDFAVFLAPHVKRFFDFIWIIRDCRSLSSFQFIGIESCKVCFRLAQIRITSLLLAFKEVTRACPLQVI